MPSLRTHPLVALKGRFPSKSRTTTSILSGWLLVAISPLDVFGWTIPYSGINWTPNSSPQQRCRHLHNEPNGRRLCLVHAADSSDGEIMQTDDSSQQTPTTSPASTPRAPLGTAASTDNDSASPPAQTLDRDRHVDLLDKSLRYWTGRGLFEHMYPETDHDQESVGTTERRPPRHEWDDVHMSSRFCLLSHGSENGLDGPVHNYANFGACGAFQLSRHDLMFMPAARMAEPGMDQREWSMILERLREEPKEGGRGYITDYRGWRCTMPYQRRFYVRDALVWNCFDENGTYYGQALLFDRERITFMDDN